MTAGDPSPPDVLASWADTDARRRIVDFVEAVSDEGGTRYVPPAERVAVFDNDGTLWCEKPMPVELGFILQRFREMADRDECLRDRQPWKAAWESDYAWLGDVITQHYHGDDSNVRVLIGGLLKAFDGMTVATYAALADEFLQAAVHPTLGRRLRDCAYLPMVELLRYLEANGFATYIASGGNRDFMRPMTSDVYGIPPERVIGSSSELRYREDDGNGLLVYQAEMDVFDDGPAKPVRIWSRVGRPPLVAGGNSNGDIPMLQFAGAGKAPGLRLLVLHDDADREFAYVQGAEQSLQRARSQGWTVISIKEDWTAVFSEAPVASRVG
jgi:phosphoserine phosphatase